VVEAASVQVAERNTAFRPVAPDCRLRDLRGMAIRELDHRRSDGIDVWLRWCERDGRTLVEVRDSKTGGHFTIEVRDDERALDVFRHPYAYAAWRRIDTRPVTAAPIATPS
jgi:hypothetical protein